MYLSGQSLRQTPCLSISQIRDSNYIRLKSLAKAIWIGFKTRKILNSNEILNYKRNIQDYKEFYKKENTENKYMKKVKKDYGEAVIRAMRAPNWWKKFVFSKQSAETQERVQKIRERNARLKQHRVD